VRKKDEMIPEWYRCKKTVKGKNEVKENLTAHFTPPCQDEELPILMRQSIGRD
jgi:hypothetical protein